MEAVVDDVLQDCRAGVPEFPSGTNRLVFSWSAVTPCRVFVNLNQMSDLS